MKNKLYIFNTSILSAHSRTYYSKSLRKKFVEIRPEIIKIPSLVYLVDYGDKKILFNCGTSYNNPMGSGFLGKMLTRYYKVKTKKEIWGQLSDCGIGEIDKVILSHLHPDHLTGALSQNKSKVKIKHGFFAHKSEIVAAKKFIPKLLFSREDIKKFEINPLDYDENIELLPGHTFGGHIGFWVNKNILLVGDAIENPIFMDKDAIISKVGRKAESKKTFKKLKEFSDNGVLLLSNHDFCIKPTNGENFIGSKQHKKLLDRQREILEKINLHKI